MSEVSALACLASRVAKDKGRFLWTGQVRNGISWARDREKVTGEFTAANGTPHRPAPRIGRPFCMPEATAFLLYPRHADGWQRH